MSDSIKIVLIILTWLTIMLELPVLNGYSVHFMYIEHLSKSPSIEVING